MLIGPLQWIRPGTLNDSAPQPRPAGLFRRLAALVYDAILLLAVLFVATALVLPLSGGEAITHNPLFSTWLLLVSFFFYAWSWVHGGQTLGLRTWHMRLERLDGGPIGWWQALLRFLSAIPSWALFGLGYLWILVDRDKLAWHDRISETRIVRIDPPAR